jgi:hypothetical protein
VPDGLQEREMTMGNMRLFGIASGPAVAKPGSRIVAVQNSGDRLALLERRLLL